MADSPSVRDLDRRWAIGIIFAMVAAFVAAGVLVLRSELTEDPTRSPGAWEVAWDYLAAVDERKPGAAAKLTDDPKAARSTLAKVLDKLPDAKLVSTLDTVRVRGGNATGSFDVRWTLEEDRTFSYHNDMTLVRADGRWVVDWSPAVLHPQLESGQHIAVVTRSDAPAVVDARGRSLMIWGDIGPEPVKPDRAKLLLPGMLERAQASGVPEKWAVAALDAKGKRVRLLSGSGPKLAKPVRSTLSILVQDAAQRAVDGQGKPAALVAFQPSTGAILAIAQNKHANQGPIALSGLYPPGSVFEIVTAAAALESGVIPPDSTSFAGLPKDPPAKGVVVAANELGLNADFAIPGIETEAGGLRRPAGLAQRLEVAKGQGEAKASPFGLALISATVAVGKTVVPKLWSDKPTKVIKSYPAPGEQTVAALRAMMRGTVTGGPASALQKYGEVHGKPGTSKGGDGVTHSWFTGFVKDIAFAVLVEDGGSAQRAVQVSGKFLGAL